MTRVPSPSIVAAALGVMLVASAARAQDCVPSWLPTFSAATGLSDRVEDLAVLDDGSGGGAALYAGGSFVTAGSDGANFVARWDGDGWSPLGTGLNNPSYALTAFDDRTGDGPALYVGGAFTIAGGVVAHRIARWDGTSWSNLGSGMDGFVRDLCVFDDGSGHGPELYAAGEFSKAGDLTVNHIAKWNGSSWRALGVGTNLDVLSLAVFDDGRGGGPALYAAGVFTTAGGNSANHIARWDGSSWSALAQGVSAPASALAVVDLLDGAGPRLCVGGSFNASGLLEVHHVALWDGTGWSALGSGTSEAVRSLAVFDDGGGPALIAGGSFTTAGGIQAMRIAKWDGTSWSPLGGGMSGAVQALVVYDDGSGGGPALFAGGQFVQAYDSGDSYLAKWGCPAPTAPWTDLGSGLAGLTGVPALAGTGTLEAGSPGALTLTNAQPAALTNLFVSFASTPAPFKGGVLMPVPSALMLALFTNGVGSIPLAWAAWPAGVPSGSSLYFQYGIADPAAPAGVALSNALQAVTP